MIQKVISFLNAKLELTNYFSSIYELSEIIKKSDGKSSPKAYCSNGEFKELSNYDYSYGQSYWRKAGDVTLSMSERDTIACSNAIIFRVPLKLVCFVPKEKLSADDAYSDDKIAQTLIKQITTNNSELRSLLKAKRFTITPSKYTTNNHSILSEEYDGYSISDISHNICYLSIDFDIEITTSQTCIESECDVIDNDILHIFDFCNDTIAARLTATQVDCLEARYGIECGNVIITNSVGVQKYSKAPGETQAIPKHTIYQSNGSTVVTTKEFDENYTTPVVTITTSEGGSITKEAGETYSCTAYPAITYNYPAPTGNTVVYQTGDDADIQALYFGNLVQGVKNSLVDFSTLASNNSFGNVNRFTDSLGTQLFANDYVIDNFTGLGWYRIRQGVSLWTNAISGAQASVVLGFTDWFLPNVQQLDSIVRTYTSARFTINYSPFNVPNSNYWTSTTVEVITSAIELVATAYWQAPSKGNGNYYLLCRKHF